MDKEARTAILEKERAIGEIKGQVYEVHIRPYIEQKRVDLFNAFQNVGVTDVEALKEIKLQLTALDGLEADFITYMETGRMASMSLKEEKDG